MTSYNGTGDYSPWTVPEVGDYLTFQWASTIGKMSARSQISWTFTGTKAGTLGTTLVLDYSSMGFSRFPFVQIWIKSGDGWTDYHNVGYWNNLLEPPGGPNSYIRLYGIDKSFATLYLGDTAYPNNSSTHPFKITMYGC